VYTCPDIDNQLDNSQQGGVISALLNIVVEADIIKDTVGVDIDELHS